MKRAIKKWILDIVIILLVIAIGIPALHYGYGQYLRSSYPLSYIDQVNFYADQFELPPSLVYGVIYTESHFDPDAVSSAGAKGLMQLMDSTFEWVLEMLGEEDGDVFDPETNIRCGTKVLDILNDELENTETVLAAYNAGIGNVRKWLQDSQYSNDGKTLHTIPFPETREYVMRVLEAQKMYQTLYEIP